MAAYYGGKFFYDYPAACAVSFCAEDDYEKLQYVSWREQRVENRHCLLFYTNRVEESITMLKMKQGLALMMVTSFAVLAACGQTAGNTKTNNGANADPTNEANEAPAPKEPVTIEFWYGLGGKLGETMKEKIDLFNNSQQEVIVKGIAQADYSETEQKLQAAIAAKQAPAAVLSSNMNWAKKDYSLT